MFRTSSDVDLQRVHKIFGGELSSLSKFSATLAKVDLRHDGELLHYLHLVDGYSIYVRVIDEPDDLITEQLSVVLR